MKTIPKNLIEAAIADALSEAKRTKKRQYVRAIVWDGLYASIGFGSDPDMGIGTPHAIVYPDQTVRRLWVEVEAK